MIVVRELDDPGFGLPASVVTIGAFDGLHRGHQRLVTLAGDAARAERLALVVVSFDRHPLRYLAPERVPPLVTTPTQRDAVLASLGASVLYLLHFGPERAGQDPEAFVADVLVDRLGARHVVVGENFTFGARGAGRPEDLVRLGGRHGFDVRVEPLVSEGGAPVSASRVRALVAEGSLEEAARLLGRPFQLEGVVVAGDGRGRALGFPTANVVVSSAYASPPDGIYAGWALLDGEQLPAAISLGTRPTFYPHGGPRLLEVYVLDRELDLYGRAIEVSFHSRVRGQESFAHVDALVARMRADVAEVAKRTDVARGRAG